MLDKNKRIGKQDLYEWTFKAFESIQRALEKRVIIVEDLQALGSAVDEPGAFDRAVDELKIVVMATMATNKYNTMISDWNAR